MALTSAQMLTLKNDALAQPTLATAIANGDDMAVAAFYNAIATPAFRVWKTRLSSAEVHEAITWTELIARSVGERDTLVIILSPGVINPSKANIRQAFLDIFSGAGGVNSRTALTAASKRDSTVFEKLFAAGTGSDGSPATMAVEGPLTLNDVALALRG